MNNFVNICQTKEEGTNAMYGSISVTYPDWVTPQRKKHDWLMISRVWGAGGNTCLQNTQLSFGLVKCFSLIEVKGCTIMYVNVLND